mmetsp:Transcript_4975/g.12858  ORF Transcript_4975/g.12858 Transcript_4975/m.12858 type:complete len:540 (-) Transcript_4975:355-1974(-)
MQAQAPDAFLAELAERFAKLPEKPLEHLYSLSATDDSFLTLDAGETTQTFPAIQARFAASWPEEHPLNGPVAISMVTMARKRDKALQKRVDRLVPKKVTERAFWRHYFSRVHAILVAVEPSALDKLVCHLDSLPRPRPLEDRRFPPAATLRTEGEITREELLDFVIGCTKMVTSEESLRLVATAIADGITDVTTIMMAFQLEFMESKGLDRQFGVALMSPYVLHTRFPGDEQIFKVLNSFMQNCQQASQVAQQSAMQRASSDPKARKFQPAASLQREGELTDARLLDLIESTESIVADPELKPELMNTMRTTGHGADSILIRWQREYLESVGLEQDFAVGQLRKLPMRAQKAAAAKSTDAEASELGRTFAALRKMANMLEQLGAAATIEVSRPTPREIALRRFKPSDIEGGPPLQTTGILSREQVIAFCDGCSKFLLEDDSLEILSSVDENTMGALSVSWQREYLEHLAIEQDFGCRQLSLVPERYKSDRGVLTSFANFQKACVTSMKTCQLRRQEKAAARIAEMEEKGEMGEKAVVVD